MNKTTQNGAALSEDKKNGEAVKTAEKHLCQLIMTAEKVLAETIKIAGEKHRPQAKTPAKTKKYINSGRELRRGNYENRKQLQCNRQAC